MRKVTFADGEFYHVYNQGVDGRNITLDPLDSMRFIQSLQEFNVEKPIGSIYENSFAEKDKKQKPLVRIIVHCLNPNHFHLIVEQVMDGGISKFFQRVLSGYTKYFNELHERRGALLVPSRPYTLRTMIICSTPRFT